MLMAKKRRAKWLIVIVISLVGLVAAVGLMWRLGFMNSVVAELTAPTCSSPVLTVLPSNEQNIDSITPLGNISLPQHALPTEHTYHVLKRGPDGIPLNTEVFAPANLAVTTITHISSIRDGQQRDNDYKVDMLLCKGVHIKFDHIRELSPKLAAAYTASKPKCQENQLAGDLNKYCKVELNLTLSAGELIGMAGGGLPTAFDFGATDDRSKPLEFANNQRYGGSTRQTVCPYDLYGQDMKDRFYKLLGESAQRRIDAPICGTIAQDVPGTAQGNWFDGQGKSSQLEQQQKTMSLIHDNVDAKLGLLVLGRQNAKVIFTPTHSGLINREFSEVKPGQDVYCYQPTGSSSRAAYGTQSVFKGSVLIRLASEAELDFEVTSKDCGNAAFTSPTRYSR